MWSTSLVSRVANRADLERVLLLNNMIFFFIIGIITGEENCKKTNSRMWQKYILKFKNHRKIFMLEMIVGAWLDMIKTWIERRTGGGRVVGV